MNDFESPIPEEETAAGQRLKRLAACLEEHLRAELLLQCMQALAAALDRLHKRGYVCLNLSPETILVGRTGEAALAADCPVMPQGAFAYPDPELWCLPKSQEYAAPEVICFHGEYLERKRMARIAHRADIYSLGLVLCRCLFETGPMTEKEKRRLLGLLSQSLKRELLRPSFQCLPDAALEELRRLLLEMLLPVSAVRTVSMDNVICRLGTVCSLAANYKAPE